MAIKLGQSFENVYCLYCNCITLGERFGHLFTQHHIDIDL